AACATVCGDGLVVGAEACDDTNTTGGDGCNATCAAVEAGWTCAAPGLACSTTCGDGIVAGAETCDDANAIGSDGCDATCTTEAGWVCATAGAACIATCGDGLVVGAEACDDTNILDGDGCTAACAIEAGWTCASAGVPCLSVCGDGLVVGAETCDDTNANGSDGCSSLCAVETGWTCATAGAACTTNCGDGLLVGTEACDDTNAVAGDGCSSACAIEAGYACTGTPSVCLATCGDAMIVGSETCDDGNVIAGDGCDAQCALEAGHAFESGDNGGTATANGPYASTIIIHGAITPAGDYDYFTITTTATTDLRIETFDGDPARATCSDIDTFIHLYSGTGTQLTTDDDDGLGTCSMLSTTGDAAVRRMPAGTYYVAVRAYSASSTIPAYQLVVTFVAVCGDGAITGLEQCDDGNVVDDATCNANCTTPACGDGIVGNTAGETCDDGNGTSGDGCDANCTPTACGNGVVTTGEQCDDGNVTAGDGCGATCALEELCGNGVIDAGEQCDDGNASDGDGCSFTTTPKCQVEPGHYYEQEPNDDGTPSTSSDFLASAANPAGSAFTGTTIIHGAITPVGDDDVFAVRNDTTFPVTVRFDVYNAAPGYGLDVACGASIDTNFFVLDAAGATLTSNDDRNGAADRCSGLSYAVGAGVTVYARLIRYGDGTAIPAPGYLLRITVPVCGNGASEAGEVCDDGNLTSGDGCDQNCTVSACGNGVAAGTEVCDDGNAVSGDGCDSNCTLSACGNGVRAGAEQCDDGNTLNGDGCSSTCVLEEPCGNDVLDPGEQCDDGNQLDGDGCTFSTSPRCQLEAGHFFESEPNDDGAVATGTNDTSLPDANGPTGPGSSFSSDIIIHGKFAPDGDDDTYRITNTTASAISMRIDTWSPALGVGRRCGTSIDTAIYVYGTGGTGTTLTSNLDRYSSWDRCSGSTYSIAAGATIYLRVIWYGATASSLSSSDVAVLPEYGTARYLVTLRFPVCGDGVVQGHRWDGATFGEECEPASTATCDATCQRVPVCGDRFIDAPETCDDGNTIGGDGCSGACARELTAITEAEPNDSAAAAQELGTINALASTYLEIAATAAPPVAGVQDHDFYRFTLTAPMEVTLTTYATTGTPFTGASTVDTVILLWNGVPTNITATQPAVPGYTGSTATEARLVEYDDDDGPGSFSNIPGTNTARADTNATRVRLGAGTYYVLVRPFSTSSPVTTTSFFVGLEAHPAQ
ncbi:DUF4215 domain-containing protein, partial [Myxococcota bacterium]|nr:DUF4215 domain-containing protein [Myxococcota bacterium]